MTEQGWPAVGRYYITDSLLNPLKFYCRGFVRRLAGNSMHLGCIGLALGSALMVHARNRLAQRPEACTPDTLHTTCPDSSALPDTSVQATSHDLNKSSVSMSATAVRYLKLSCSGEWLAPAHRRGLNLIGPASCPVHAIQAETSFPYLRCSRICLRNCPREYCHQTC